jgi:hypothetical protein
MYSSINNRREKKHCLFIVILMDWRYSRCRQETLRCGRLTPCDRPMITTVSKVEGFRAHLGVEADIRISYGPAIAQAVSRWLHTAAVSVRAHAR